MIAAKQFAGSWFGKVAAVAMAAFMMIVSSAPSPREAIHGLEDRAVQRLTPVMSRTEVGRQVLAVYVERDKECHSAL